MRNFTPDELATVRAMSATGSTRKDTLKAIRIAPATFDHHCKALGITFHVRPASEHSPRRKFTPEELALVRREAAAGKPKREVLKLIRIGFDPFTRLCREHGIVFATAKSDRTHVRGAASPARKAARKKQRNPMKDINTWRPPEASGSLELAVQKLRTRYSPVCAEATIRNPREVPKPYTMRTLFRIGAQENVTAAQVMEAAALLKDSAMFAEVA